MEMAMKRLLEFTLIFCLQFLRSVHPIVSNCDSIAVDGGDRDSLPLGTALRANQTIKSENGTFELGFFSPNGSNNWYVGIWYPEKTIVWVANRETPIPPTSMPGVLNLSIDGHLGLFDLKGQLIWSTREQQKAKASRAMILESGNFVILGEGARNTCDTVWESFQYPGDTWLPGMKLWKGMKLSSWKSSVDPAPGPFSLEMDPSPGKTQLLVIYKNRIPYYSSGEWNGHGFSNLPEMGNSGDDGLMKFVKISPSIMYFTYGVMPNIKTMMPRIILFKTGEVRAYFWIYNSRWSFIWSQPRDQCSVYDVCGAFGTCNKNNVQFCSCLQGFIPRDNSSWDSKEWWNSGCVRRTPLQCSVANSTLTADGFLQLTNKSLPDDRAVPYTQKHSTLEDCEASCMTNCSCTAFAITNSTPPMCRLWFGDLLNVRDSSDNQSIFIRLAASELAELSSKVAKAKATSKVSALSILLPACLALALVLVFLFAMFIRSRRRTRPTRASEEDEVPTSLRTFTYKELQIASKKFKHKLGSGAFGSVYRGTLPDNTLVAVKKLQGSHHAEKQFRAEISTIGNIQHVNLVKLVGFCAEGSRRLLVYEYMPNGSLNSLLFRQGGVQNVLSWKNRFDIAIGIAKGLAYLHEECRDRIIHCDIKPENILLDSDLRPKVADFGLAKLVGRDFSRVLTTTRGTRGYLAPEWISGLPITPKADVYSFGMTLLEIISGRRNLDFTVESSKFFFPAWSATQLQMGNIAAVVDERIANSADIDEVRRAAAVGQLCIQQDENLRPNMAQVVQLLEGTIDPSMPQIPSPLQDQQDENSDSDSYFIF